MNRSSGILDSHDFLWISVNGPDGFVLSNPVVSTFKNCQAKWGTLQFWTKPMMFFLGFSARFLGFAEEHGGTEWHAMLCRGLLVSPAELFSEGLAGNAGATRWVVSYFVYFLGCFFDGNILPKQVIKVKFLTAGYFWEPRFATQGYQDWLRIGIAVETAVFGTLLYFKMSSECPFKTAGWAHQKYCSIWKHCFSILVWEPVGPRTSYSHLFCSWKTMVVPERNDGHVTLVSFRSFFSGYRRPMPYSGQVKTESNFLLLEPPFPAPRIAVKQPEPIPSSKLI